jgi:cyclohexa-1,5-dienecarbonyl-CoA hydratase
VADYRCIIASSFEGLATLRINRAPLNVLDIATLEEMSAALDDLAADPTLRLLVVAAAGEKAFSAGVEVADHTPDKVDRMIDIFHAVVRKIEAFPTPTLAAVHGAALGGGLEVALACDMIVAASGAKLGQPEIKLAVFAPVAAVLLPRLLPRARANEMLYGGGIMTAEEALQYGLVNRDFPRETFVEDARAFSRPFLELSRAALLASKKAVRLAATAPFTEALAAVEKIYLQELMRTADAKEGLAAFLEKRTPIWRHH